MKHSNVEILNFHTAIYSKYRTTYQYFNKQYYFNYLQHNKTIIYIYLQYIPHYFGNFVLISSNHWSFGRDSDRGQYTLPLCCVLCHQWTGHIFFYKRLPQQFAFMAFLQWLQFPLWCSVGWRTELLTQEGRLVSESVFVLLV